MDGVFKRKRLQKCFDYTVIMVIKQKLAEGIGVSG